MATALDRLVHRPLSLVVVAVTALGGLLGAQAAAAPSAAAASGAHLSVSATASPTAVSRVGQDVAYTVVVRNAGDVTLRDLVVRDPAAGLSALVCSPVALGGQVAPGASTTCRASRTTTVEDLRRSSLTDTLKATAATSTQAVNAAVTVSVPVRTSGPVATDDTAPAVEHGPDVLLPGATNDQSGVVGGAPLDPSRTVFVDAPADVDGGKRWTTPEGTWTILPDGSVRFRIGEQVDSSQTGEVAYRVYDTAGRSAVGHLRVPVRRGPYPAFTTVDTPQGQAVTVDVLGRDDPGQDPDGSASTFDRSSLRVANVQGSLLASYPPDQKSATVYGEGTYVIGSDARVTFTPVDSFWGAAPTLVYTARSTAGATMTGTLKVEVDRNRPIPPPTTSGPVASDDAVVTTRQLGVQLPAQTNDFGGSKGLVGTPVFPTDQLGQLPGTSEVRRDGKELYVPRQGVYDVFGDDPQVWFNPARGGYTGAMSPVVYEITDAAGVTSRAQLRVTVLPGPTEKPEYVGTRQNQSVTVDVYGDDDPGTDPTGQTPPPVYDRTELTAVGVPNGSSTSPDDHRLTVPGQGVYTVNPGNGSITFDPETGFTGVASEITFGVYYLVQRPQLPPETVGLASTLRVTVRADTPVARADTVTSTAGKPVVARVLGNDAAGSSATPLVPSSVRLRLTGGLPAGSVLYGDAKTLVVPPGRAGTGGAEFLVSGRGEITVVPTGSGPPPPLTVGYQVADANGTTARSTLAVGA